MKTDEIRQSFLEFFRSIGHEVVPGDSLVPKDDPTLLFTGAGMNQFKEKFLGRNITYRRAASSQKCLRTADLEKVGQTPNHHTFFEMLGNFSFGDYFKKEAILWAWEFLNLNLGIKPDSLWVSVYKDDTEAYGIWKDLIKVPSSRIVKLGEKENFWPSEAPSKGPNGPCGPCSEIFYDWGNITGCGKTGCSPACDCGRFCEVWNLVFTQFDRQPDGNLKPLPNKNIDTGMGLERIAAVMQGVKTNFEIDVFAPITETIEGMGHKSTGAQEHKSHVNAIADHIRAITFTIADGVMPSNEERGYVVRKLIRRSVSHGADIGIKAPFLYKLVSVVANVMSEAYPEIKSRRDDIAQVVKREEEGYLSVIGTQLPRVEEAFSAIRRTKNDKSLPETAFNFYDTYGMPYDMLEEIAEKFDLKIDRASFESLLDKQRAQSRAGSKIRSEIFSETFAKRVESLGLKTEFLGYERSHAEALVLEVLEGGEVILDKTPFYGESGGQAGDWGRIETMSGEMEVEDAKKFGKTIVHIGTLRRGRIVKGETAKVSIDDAVRKNIMCNHTATHLLHAALRKVLGEHVRQTGSMVDNKRLRFDFTHMKKMEPREVARAEELVNENIKRGIPVKKEIKRIAAAKAEGATALFGEKYEDMVRVVSIGDVSKELCGGTHVDNTKEIDIFRIISESSIASGTRRIEAVTGDEAREWERQQKEAEGLKLKAEREKEASKKTMQDRLKKELDRLDYYISKAKDISGTKFIGEIIKDVNMDILRVLADRIKKTRKDTIIILATKTEGKAAFIVSVDEEARKRGVRGADDLARELAGFMDGSGGGRPDFAQGGGKDPSRLEGALKNISISVKGGSR